MKNTSLFRHIPPLSFRLPPSSWHESKKRITRDRWVKALGWMKENNFAPVQGGVQ